MATPHAQTALSRAISPGDLPCLRCGYSLLGLPAPAAGQGPRCPECGAEHTRRYLSTGQPPSGPRPWSAALTLAIVRPAWTAAAAACCALAVVASAAGAAPLALGSAAMAGWAAWRRIDLGLRPERVERMDGLMRAALGPLVATWAGLCVGAVLALGAVGALILWGRLVG